MREREGRENERERRKGHAWGEWRVEGVVLQVGRMFHRGRCCTDHISVNAARREK